MNRSPHRPRTGAHLRTWLGVGAAALLALGYAPATAQDLLIQSTTSTRNAGLYEHILPQFTAKTGLEVAVVAVGTGQALRNARNCDGDVLLTHARDAEEAFVADGFGVARHDVMYNDFIIVGPPADPANARAAPTAAGALSAISAAAAVFASRGDDSGTHRKEMALWNEAAVDPLPASGTWYREMGAGMGATLNAAVAMDAYTLTDRATWIAFQNKGAHEIHLEGDPALFNQYGVILVSQAACPSVRAKAGQRFVDWLLSPEGQAAIASHTVAGQQLFFPNAAPRE